MKKQILILMIFVAILSLSNLVISVSVGSGSEVGLYFPNFKPIVFLCDNNLILNSNTTILVLNSNGINNLESVSTNVLDLKLTHLLNDTLCAKLDNKTILNSCDLREYKSEITGFNDLIMSYYSCKIPLANKNIPNKNLALIAKDLGGLEGSWQIPIISCLSNLECNTNNPHSYDSCLNPGTPQSYCNHTQIVCLTNNDCNDNNTRTADSCINPGTLQSYCKNENISCFTDRECGENKFIQNPFCSNGSVNQNYLQFKCLNSGTAESSCKNETLPKLVKTCKFGCVNATCIKDTTPPEAIISFDNKIKDLVLKGVDDLDKNISVSLKESCIKLFVYSNCNREYTISDSSNNTLKIKLNFKKYLSNYLTYQISSLKYNNKEFIQKYNYFDITFLNPGKIIQNIFFTNNFNSNAQYDPKKNKTEIKIFTSGKPKIYTKDGLNLVGLSTNKGAINYLV